MTRSTLQARLVVDELVRCGITDAVLCPGSRNAPLSFALHAADAAGRLRLHVRIDERTAGFLALGLALRSGRPVTPTSSPFRTSRLSRGLSRQLPPASTRLSRINRNASGKDGWNCTPRVSSASR